MLLNHKNRTKMYFEEVTDVKKKLYHRYYNICNNDSYYCVLAQTFVHSSRHGPSPWYEESVRDRIDYDSRINGSTFCS